MANIDQIQINVAKGRFTFPLAICSCLLLRLLTASGWEDCLSLLACAFTAYALIETNTAFTLIRTRTTLDVSLYIFLSTLTTFFTPYSPTLWVVPLLLLAHFALFRSYESHDGSSSIFHAFLFLSIGSLLFPPLLWLSPLLFIGMGCFRSFHARSFFAAWIGLAVPYWFSFGYHFLTHNLEPFYRQVEALTTWEPLHYSRLGFPVLLFGAVILLMTALSSIHYLLVSYQDKTRTRLFLSYLVGLEALLTLFGMLQPTRFEVALQLLLLPSSVLTAHLFTLTRNRFSGIYFLCTFAGLIILTLLFVWMQFFNS